CMFNQLFLFSFVLHTVCSFFFFYGSGAHRDLHSFPTRRSSDLRAQELPMRRRLLAARILDAVFERGFRADQDLPGFLRALGIAVDRKSTRLNSSHLGISYAVFCLKKKKKKLKIYKQQNKERTKY